MLRAAGASQLPCVLVVDDQPSNIHLLSQALGDAYEIFFATTGESALKIAGEKSIDIVLLDVVMPGMDGFEVCRRLKMAESTKGIPVMFVTGMNEVDDEARGFAIGGVDYITKPISPSLVRARVRTHVELKRQKDLLEELASIDSLTEIPNRRQFDTALRDEWQRASRSRAPMAVMLADVDYFKQYNDHYGHSMGDDCLRNIARALSGTLQRSTDVVARYGGEEFGVVVPATDWAELPPLVSALLQSVNKLDIPHEPSTVADHVTISIGAACGTPAVDSSLPALLDAADRLLYKAKGGGRSQGVCGNLEGDKEAVVTGMGEVS